MILSFQYCGMLKGSLAVVLFLFLHLDMGGGGGGGRYA